MKSREPPQTLRAALALAASLAACDALVPVEPPAPIFSGAAGEGGSADAGAGGDVGGDNAGAGADAGETGGGGADAGAGGQGDDTPRVGVPCDVQGALACAGVASPSTLVCDGGAWRAGTPCDDEPVHLCDRSTGACAPKLCERDECSVDGGHAHACGPDKVTLISEACLFGCNPDNGRCRGPAPNVLVVDRPRETLTRNAFWPEPVIPVCLADPDAWSGREGLLAALRTTVERTWGRHAGVAFPGWVACSEDVARIELDVLEACEGELVRVSRAGYPGPSGAVSLGFCATYHDSDPRTDGDPRDLASDLLAAVALHAFGHALGLDDEGFDPAQSSFMQRAFELPARRYVDLRSDFVEWLQGVYGQKPEGSLLGASGLCLSLPDAAPGASACDGSPDQRFEAAGGALRRRGDATRCLGSGEETGVAALLECDATDPEQLWEPRRVRWMGSGNRCVALTTGGGSPLGFVACDPAWPDAQTFWFELEPGGSARVHHAGNCVLAPDASAIPVLGDCTDSSATFLARDGQLESKGRCVTGGNGVVLERCSTRLEQRFHLSGPFDGSNGRALEWLDGAPLGSASATSPPRETQILDYHF